MARHTFAGGPSDYVLVTTSGTWRNAGPSTCTVWSAESGGTQVTDLLIDGQAATALRLGSTGRIPTFQGPDGVEELWLEVPGVPSRVRLTRFGAQGPTGPGADVTGAEIEAARDEAQAAKTAAETARTAAESAAAAAEAGGTSTDAVMAARLADPDSLSSQAVAEVVRIKAVAGDPLRKSKIKLATNPREWKFVGIPDSNLAGDARGATFWQNMLAVQTQKGQPLEGAAAASYFTDMVANGTTTIQSEAANFLPEHKGRFVHGDNIQTASIITEVINENTVTLSKTVATGTGLRFWIGLHIIPGGNNGMPLRYWLDNPNFGPEFGNYNQQRYILDAPDVTLISNWNDWRQGKNGVTFATIVPNVIALLTEAVEHCMEINPNPDAEFVLETPHPLLTTNVGGTNFVTDAQNNPNPPGLAQIYSDAVRAGYLAMRGRYPNVAVLDMGRVWGTLSLPSHPYWFDQGHLSTNTNSDIMNYARTGGGCARRSTEIARFIGNEPRQAHPVDAYRTTHRFMVYAAPSAGTIRISSLDPIYPAPEAPLNRNSTLYFANRPPLSLAGATISRGFSTEWIEISGGTLAGIDFKEHIGSIVDGVGQYATVQNKPVSINVGTVTAGTRKTITVTVPGVAPANLGYRGAVEIELGAAFAASALEYVHAIPSAVDQVELVVENPTASDITIAAELALATIFN